jgi:hypothetical protein
LFAYLSCRIIIFIVSNARKDSNLDNTSNLI